MSLKSWSAVIAGAGACIAVAPLAQAFEIGKIDVRLNTPGLYIASIPLKGQVPVGLSVHIPNGQNSGIKALWWSGSHQTIAIMDREGAPRSPVRVELRWNGGSTAITIPGSSPVRHPKRTHPSKATPINKAAPIPPMQATISNRVSTENAVTMPSVAHAKDLKKDLTQDIQHSPPDSSHRSVVHQYQVRPGDTAWGLAERLHENRWAPGRSIEQIIHILVRLNPHAFVNENPNDLIASTVLRIPEEPNSFMEFQKPIQPSTVRPDKTASVAKHRLLTQGVGKQRISKPDLPPKQQLKPDPLLSKGWAFFSSFQVPPHHLGILSIARLINATTTLTTEQVAYAIFRANPHAFQGGNPFSLKTGVTLDMPSIEEIQSIEPSKAAHWWMVAEAHWQQ